MMISGFLLIITLGHLYCAMFVMIVTMFMYKEIISLKRRKDKDEKMQYFWLDW